MEIITTPIEGLLEIKPKVYTDRRGWFLEVFKQPSFQGITQLNFVQDNLSFSQKGVLRGLHLQLQPFQQAKLVVVLQGEVCDIVVDLRKGSPTFGKSHSCILDSKTHRMLYVPEGFAHGFSALQDSLFLYKCTSVYSPAHETGIRWDDPHLGLDWQITNPILSDKDQELPTFQELLIKSVISPE